MSTDDSPEREFDVYDREDFPIAPLEGTEGTSLANASESEDMSNPSNSTDKQKSCQTPRREVWWLNIGAKKQSLESIKRCFEDRLDRFLSSSSDSLLLRHITSPMDGKLRHNLHQCPGYLREEITLASDLSKSAIISHAFPSQSEVCSICGQLVQYKCKEPSSPPTASQDAQLDDLFTSYLDTMNLTDFSMQSRSSAFAKLRPSRYRYPSQLWHFTNFIFLISVGCTTSNQVLSR